MKTLTHLGINPKVNEQNIGVITIRGYQIISDEDLLALRTRASNIGINMFGQQAVMEVLDLCKTALMTPQGHFKTAKAATAYAAIVKLTGDV